MNDRTAIDDPKPFLRLRAGKCMPCQRSASSVQHRSGFTLFELSIVLVIIGFLVGGVVMGQTLIRASELRSVMTEVGSYTKAIKLFQDKYYALPGDMSNAETYWGSDAGGCPNGVAGSTTKQVPTCNGDGDGRISLTNTDTGSTTVQYEWFRAWQQLSDAGMMDAAFTGVAGAGASTEAIVGQNVPASRLTGGGYTLRWIIGTVGSASYYPTSYGHTLTFGANASNNATQKAILTPAEALEIDRKFDDGKPAYGTIMTFRTGGAIAQTCANNAAAASAAYDTTILTSACALIFILGF